MHKCLKCGRIVDSVSQISEGCTCGSKVFVFARQAESLSSDTPSPARSAARTISLIPDLISKRLSALSAPSAPASNPAPTSAPASPSAPASAPREITYLSNLQNPPAPSPAASPAESSPAPRSRQPAVPAEPVSASHPAALHSPPASSASDPSIPSKSSDPRPSAPSLSVGSASPAPRLPPTFIIESSPTDPLSPNPLPIPSAPASGAHPLDADPTQPSVASAPIPSPADEEEDAADLSHPYHEVWLSKGGRVQPLEGRAPIQSALSPSASPDPSGPDAIPAAPRAGDPSSDPPDSDPSAPADAPAGVANVRQVQTGIYEIDVGRLRGEPLVVEDSDGVYYVRLPFVPLGESAPGESVGNGPKRA